MVDRPPTVATRTIEDGSPFHGGARFVKRDDDTEGVLEVKAAPAAVGRACDVPAPFL
jgi:hypothetical protein